MNEETLSVTVRRAQQGDARAFDCLVRRYQNTAVAYARTLVPGAAAAEDAAQEAFVQAWRDLPRLADPAAFGAWFRRIVFKYCDRNRRASRPTLGLEETVPIPMDQQPARVIERADDAFRVRAAVDALPGPLKEATLLYYMAGHDVREISEFLEVPPSTVKNRLHAARKRLRKELWAMAEVLIETDKPSRSNSFAENVLGRVLREFHRQEAMDPHAVDRDLLEQGRSALDQILATSTALDETTIRDGFTLLWRKWDFQALSALLMRYLAQPLTDSETAWAYLHLANAIAMVGSAAGAVLAHETFERWMPGKSPCLSAHWPYYPANDGTEDRYFVGEEVRLLFLMQSAEFTTSYHGIWRDDDYLAKVDSALASIPIPDRIFKSQFYVLRMACNTCEVAEKFDRAQVYIRQMYALAAVAIDRSDAAELRAKALGHDIELARRTNRTDDATAGTAELSSLLSRAAVDGLGSGSWLRGERHNFACELIHAGLYEMALPLLEANAATGGQIGGWGWLIYAATVWQLTHSRERVLELLREAAAHDDRNMTEHFSKRPEFADVREDAAFLAAIGR